MCDACLEDSQVWRPHGNLITLLEVMKTYLDTWIR